MATTRQKKLAKIIVENARLDKPLNKGQMLEKVGYSKSVAKAKANDIIESEGVQSVLSEMGFTEEGAKKVVEEIMYDTSVDPAARLKATDQVFKVQGSYSQDGEVNKTLVLVISSETAERYGVHPTRNTEKGSDR